MPRSIDVDAVLADAETETEKDPEPGVLTFRGQEFQIAARPRSHLALAEVFEGGNQAAILRALFEDEYARLRALNPTREECVALIHAAAQLMAGLGLGESSGSADSSPSTSEPSGPTSGTSTG